MIKRVRNEFEHIKDKLVILAVIFISIFVFGMIGYSLTKNIAPQDALVLTIETLGFVHHEDAGFPKAVAIILLVFGAFFIWFTMWTSLDIMMEGHFKRHFKEARFMNAIKKLKNHYIICGGGRVGLHIAELLKEMGEKYVIVEKDEYSVKDALKKNLVAVDGDALEEESLREVNVEKAKALIAVLPETEKNILIALTAKELNPGLTIYARSNKKEYIKKLKNAGAKYIFMPEFACAEEIIKNIKSTAHTLPAAAYSRTK